jgi:hypothetical protein
LVRKPKGKYHFEGWEAIFQTDQDGMCRMVSSGWEQGLVAPLVSKTMCLCVLCNVGSFFFTS